MVRVTFTTEGTATDVGRIGSVVPPIGGERREVVCAGEGGIGRDRLLPESELFDHEPTQCPAAWLVRNAAMRKFGLNPKNRKEHFEWDYVVLFAEAYGVRQQGYCHLVVASMAVIMFGAMCRYDDASSLKWRNIRFAEDGSGFDITFEKRKNC